VAAGQRFLVFQSGIQAGRTSREALANGSAIYVTTGSRLPDGADAVVGIEDVAVDEDDMTVTIRADLVLARGAYVRSTGSDIAEGQLVLQRGHIIDSGAIGILIALGIVTGRVACVPKVAVLSTGDELVSGASSAEAGLSGAQVFDCNRPMLLTAVNEAGAAGFDAGILPDAATGTLELLRDIINSDCDVIITSGGVSRGVADYVKPSLEKLGKLHFGEVHLKPGKPTVFATAVAESGRTRLIFGLPGNPVSAYATFNVLVRPALRALLGCKDLEYPKVAVRTTVDITPDSVRPEYVRGILSADANTGGFWAEPTTKQQRSANIASVAHANCLILVPPGARVLARGSHLSALQLGPPRAGKPASTDVEEGGGATSPLGLTLSQQQAAEASSFRRLVAWLQDRTDVQNIDLMDLAGFCRNCLAKWLKTGADEALRDAGNPTAIVSIEAAKEAVYGMPYGEWKMKHQTPLKKGQVDPHSHAKAGGAGGIADTAAAGPRPCAGHVMDAMVAAVAPPPVLSVAIGILTVSDRASAGIYQDTSGPAVCKTLRELRLDGGGSSGSGQLAWNISRLETAIVPDELEAIQACITDWCDTQALNLIVTTGGTGFAPRDVTPEAVTPLLTKQAPGMAHQMWSEGKQHTPLALLSRAVCGVRNRTVVVCVPGSQDAAVQAVNAVGFCLPRAVALARGDKV